MPAGEPHGGAVREVVRAARIVPRRPVVAVGEQRRLDGEPHATGGETAVVWHVL